MSAPVLDRVAPLPPALPGHFGDEPSEDGLVPHPETIRLVRGVVRSLLLDSPAFRALDAEDRTAFAHSVVHVGAYIAELVRDDWYQSQERLGQRPVLVERSQATAGDDFKPAAASQIAGVTGETLRAIAFPVFVADLIKGTFNAIQDSSQKQMESYMQLLANVGKTVDEYTDDTITDENARAWLAQRYPSHLKVDGGRVVAIDRHADGAAPDFTADLDLTESVDLGDSSALEGTLVPAARRKLAQGRLQLLSTLVLLGINRIVVTGGKIIAAMGFHISTRDQAHAESASGVDARTSAAGSFGYGPWSASASISVAYVSSTKADSNAQLNTQTDLTGEVEIHFQSDYFPIARFADAAGIDKIRANTPVPATNTPVSIPWGDTSGLPAPEKMGTLPTPSGTPVATATPAPVPAPSPDAAKKAAAAPKPAAEQPKPAADPTKPAAKPADPAAKPPDAAAKPVDAAAKPADPAAKPVDPAAKPPEPAKPA